MESRDNGIRLLCLTRRVCLHFAEGELHVVAIMICLLAGHNWQQYVMAAADATNALKGFCYLCLLGSQLRCVVEVLEVAASTGAKVRAGGVGRVGMLLESAYFAGFSIACIKDMQFCSCFRMIVHQSVQLDRQQGAVGTCAYAQLPLDEGVCFQRVPGLWRGI